MRPIRRVGEPSTAAAAAASAQCLRDEERETAGEFSDGHGDADCDAMWWRKGSKGRG